jgi:hypothetical protein
MLVALAAIKLAVVNLFADAASAREPVLANALLAGLECLAVRILVTVNFTRSLGRA